MSTRVCVVGSFMADLVVTTPRRPRPGETVVGTRFDRRLGGKGYNQAVAACRAGAEVSFVGRVGDDDFGRDFLAGLEAEGVDRTGVVVDPEEGTGVGLPVLDGSGQNSIVVVPRANLRVTAQQVEASARLITDADVLLLQLEVPQEAVVAAARVARGSGTRVVLNPAPFRPLPDELWSLVQVLVPNEVEAAELAGVPRETPVADTARALATRFRGELVITLGERGVCRVDPGGVTTTFAPRSVRQVDSIGAGDVFCGNLAADLAAGTDLDRAVRFANVAASISVTQRGGADSAPLRSQTAQLDMAG